MFKSALFYFDKECIEKAMRCIQNISSEILKSQDRICETGVMSFIGHPDRVWLEDFSKYYSKPRTENKECVCYRYVGEGYKHSPFEHFEFTIQDLVENAIRNYDWESAGVTGFEEAELLTDGKLS